MESNILRRAALSGLKSAIDIAMEKYNYYTTNTFLLDTISDYKIITTVEFAFRVAVGIQSSLYTKTRNLYNKAESKTLRSILLMALGEVRSTEEILKNLELIEENDISNIIYLFQAMCTHKQGREIVSDYVSKNIGVLLSKIGTNHELLCKLLEAVYKYQPEKNYLKTYQKFIHKFSLTNQFKENKECLSNIKTRLKTNIYFLEKHRLLFPAGLSVYIPTPYDKIEDERFTHE